MQKHAITRLVSLVIAASLVLAACGSGDTDSDDTTTTASGETGATDAPTQPGEPVRGISDDNVVSVGAWIAESGPLAVVANIANAARLRFDQANDEGGVNGYTFDFTSIDDQSDPAQTVNAARELWENDEVFALVHPYGSGGMTAVEDYLRENDVPTLFPFADSRILFSEEEGAPDNAYGFVPFYGDTIRLMLEYAVEEQGIETLAVLHSNDVLGEAGPDGASAAAPDLGLEIVEEIGYDAGETNFAPLGRRVAESDADALLVWSFSGSTQVIEAALESGYEGLLVLHDGYRGGFFLNSLTALPYDLEGRAITNVWWTPVTESDSEVQEYVDLFNAAYPEGDVNLGQSGWIAASLFLDAVDQTTADGSELTWPALKATLDSWTDEAIAGSRGINYTADRVGATQGKVRLFEDGGWVDATDWVTYARYTE